MSKKIPDAFVFLPIAAKISHGLILSSKLPIGIMYNFLFWILQTLRKSFQYLPTNGSEIAFFCCCKTPHLWKHRWVIKAKVNDLPS